jgi:tape measure domain-containing protein
VPSSLGDLVVNLSANTSGLQRGLQRAQASVGTFASRASRAVTGFTDKLFTMRNALIGAGVTSAVGGMIKLAADAETLAVQMEVLTRSSSVAADVLERISVLAASTPFQKMDLANAARMLLAFNGNAGTVVNELRMLGDIAAGTGIRIGELAEIYGKARVQGRLFGEDINQLTGRGIPIVTELAKQFGVMESEVKALVSAGAVGFPELEEAFINLTREGGKFAGMTERLSTTTSGKISTLKDNFAELSKELGEGLLPALNDVLEALTRLSKWTSGGSTITSYFKNLGTDMELTAKSFQYSMEGTLWGEESERRRKQLYRDILTLQQWKRGDFKNARGAMSEGLPMQLTPTTQLGQMDMMLKPVQKQVQMSVQQTAMTLAQGIAMGVGRGTANTSPMTEQFMASLMFGNPSSAIGGGAMVHDNTGILGNQGIARHRAWCICSGLYDAAGYGEHWWSAGTNAARWCG